MESSFTAAKEFERDRRGDVSSSSSAQCGHTPCPPTLNSTLPLRAHFLKIETIVLWERWERKRVREPSNGRGNLLFLTPPCAYCSPSFVPDPCASFLLRFFFLGPSVDWSRRRIRRHFPFLTRKGAGVEPRHPAIILLQSQVRVPSPFPSMAP